MARKKLVKFEELHSMSNVAEMQQIDAASKIRAFVDKYQTIILELGCGKGEYVLGMAEIFDDAGFIGVDIQGERLWHGATNAKERGLDNIIFLRGQIENLTEYIGPSSVDKIWLTFPDPFLKKGKVKKRLTNPRFLEIYKTSIKEKGRIHLKTDNEKFFNYTKESIEGFGGKVIGQSTDLHGSDPKRIIQIETAYEKKYRQSGKKIFYLSFELK